MQKFAFIPICLFQFVTKRIALMKFDECPVCLELRAAALQAAFGIVFPAILAPIGSAAVSLLLIVIF